MEADDNGNIISEEFVPDEHDIGIGFYLTAYGQEIAGADDVYGRSSSQQY